MVNHLFETARGRRARVLREYQIKRELSLLPIKERERIAARAERQRHLRVAATVGVLIMAVWLCTRAFSNGFEVAVSPARFELSGKSSARLGQSMDIYNLGANATEVAVRTLDWTFSDDGKVTFHDELRPDSCRPWVALERKVIQIPARNKKAFRFQVQPPADAPRGQCRFMLAIEGVNPAHKALIESGGANLSLPVNGRIAVAVYFNVNGAEPKLELREVTMLSASGQRSPAVRVHNAGDAHGRLDGSLEARDAKGVEFELVPDGSPILPGQTRVIALAAKAQGQTTGAGTAPAHQPSYPVTTSGTLDWDRGSFKIAAEFK